MESPHQPMPRAAPHRLPDAITGKLSGFRTRLRQVKILEAVFGGAVGLLASFLVLFILDRLLETPAWLRALLLGGGVAVSAVGLPLAWHRWIRGQRRLEDVAQVVRRKYPRLGDQLLGTIELANASDADAASRNSPRLVQAAIAQAAERLQGEDLSAAVPNPRHRKRAGIASILLALTLLVTLLAPPAVRSSLARWILPWTDTPRYTFADIAVLPDPLVVPFAEPFELEPGLQPHSRWRPSSATARITGQVKFKSALNEDSASYLFTLPPQQADKIINLRVGDDRATIHLHPRTRPELSSLVATLRLPEYLGYTSDPSIAIHGGVARILAGAEVSLQASATRALTGATIDDKAQPIDDQGRLTTPFARLDSSRQHRILWVDTLGLSPRNPIDLRIEAIEDASPTISAQRDSTRQVVLETEVLSFDLSAEDDFGIRGIGLEWTSADTVTAPDRGPDWGRKLAANGDPEIRKISSRATFCAQDEGLAPGIIRIRAWAEDFLPGRNPSHSPALLLRVLNSTDHALWLSGEFSKWLATARETYEREQQLNIANRELRRLDPDELDRTENRRAIAKQAAMERENAARLTDINRSGRDLVEQGTRNPEFNAGQLESWAAMIERLDKLAEERMPSVSDLLRQASRARRSASTEATAPGADRVEGPSSSQPGKADQAAENATEDPPPPDSPVISDTEKSFLAPTNRANDDSTPPSPPGGLSLPSTTLGAIAGAQQEQDTGGSFPAGKHLDKAIAEQDELLAEFRAVAELLAELLGSFEASTFVKRLKAASRAQMEIAGTINSDTLSAFGLPVDNGTIPERPAEATRVITERASTETETIQVIQSDLAGFINRKPDRRFTALLKAMKDQRVVRELQAIPISMRKNLTGLSIAASEFWADTLDRWAEELVAAASGPP